MTLLICFLMGQMMARILRMNNFHSEHIRGAVAHEGDLTVPPFFTQHPLLLHSEVNEIGI